MNVKVKKFENGKTEVMEPGYTLLWHCFGRGGVYMPKNGDKPSYHSYNYDGWEHLEYLDSLTQDMRDHIGITYTGDCEITLQVLLDFLKADKIQYDMHVENPEFKKKLEEATEAARKLFEAAGFKL